MEKTEKLFGTDGIRGKANVHPMTPEIALRLGKALAAYAKSKNSRQQHKIVIGKDTRLSGYLLETALTSGIVSLGVDVLLVGPMPTPAIALLTKSLNCDAGIVLSASHNPADDNGIKIFAAGMENAKAGSPIITVKNESEIEGVKAKLAKEIESIEFEKAVEGIVIKADTLGSLEAMIRMLGQKNIEIRKAEAGDVHRNDVVTIESEDRLKKVILAFNVKVLEDAAEIAKARNVKIFENNIIYRLLEDYEKWVSDEKKKAEQEKLEGITRPGKILLLKGLVFRASNPAVVGVEIISGIIKSGVSLMKDGKEIGTIKEIQSEGQIVEKAERGQRVAVSMSEPTVGRHISEGDELSVKITPADLAVLEELGSAEEIALAKKALGVE